MHSNKCPVVIGVCVIFHQSIHKVIHRICGKKIASMLVNGLGDSLKKLHSWTVLTESFLCWLIFIKNHLRYPYTSDCLSLYEYLQNSGGNNKNYCHDIPRKTGVKIRYLPFRSRLNQDRKATTLLQNQIRMRVCQERCCQCSSRISWHSARSCSRSLWIERAKSGSSTSWLASRFQRRFQRSTLLEPILSQWSHSRIFRWTKRGWYS